MKYEDLYEEEDENSETVVYKYKVADFIHLVPKNEKERRTLTRVIKIEYSDLFTDLDSAIKFLTKVRDENKDKKLSLTEDWSGYETNWFEFSYEEKETDEEYESRLRLVASKKLLDDETARNENQRKREEYNKENAKLKKKYGIT